MSDVGMSEPAARARFSTDDFPRRERVDAWSEALARHCGVRIDVDPRSAGDFRSTAKLVRLPTFALLEGSTSSMRQESSRGSVVNDDVTFCSVTTSQWGMSQLGRSPDLHPGDCSLLSNSDVSEIILPEESRHIGFSVPRAALAHRVPDIGVTFAQRIPASSPALQMLTRYLDLARRDNVVTTPALAAAFGDHVCDLLALALGATRDAAELAKTRGLSAARLQAMKDDVASHLGRPDLSVNAVATRHKVSVRYVQRLFEESGSTFTQFVLDQRLAAAYKALAQRPGVPIHTIAYDHGFNDVSYFNRAFRQRYGCTPSDIRSAPRGSSL